MLSEVAGELRAFWRGRTDSYGLHQAVWRWFPDEPDARRDFLFRQEGEGVRTRFLVLSKRVPRDPTGVWTIDTKPFSPQLRAGQRLEFVLRANPVRARAGEGRGVRHDVVMDRKWRLRQSGEPQPPEADLVQEEGEAWIRSREARLGVSILDVRADGYQPERLSKRGARITMSTLELTGSLTVTDPVALLSAVHSGVGPAKAFGCGLLLLRRLA